MDDVYSLFTDEDPAARAQAMAEALRRKRGLGTLGLLSGDRVLTRVGQGLLGEADTGDQTLRAAGQERLGQRFREALEKQRQAFQAEQGRLDRSSRLAAAQAGGGGAHGGGAAKEEYLRFLVRKGEQDLANAPGKETRQVGTALRKELDGLPETKAFKDVDFAYRKLQAAAADPSAAGDLSLIFGYMKLLDPGSTVREGEFANAQNAGGLDSRLVAKYNQVLSGQRLAPEVRADFMRQAQGLYAVHEDKYRQAVERYRGLADRYGAPADDVVPQPARGAHAGHATPRTAPSAPTLDLAQPAPQAPAAPAGRQEVRDKDGKLLGYINADGSEELVGG